jgi:carboxyl-terminal processing protease
LSNYDDPRWYEQHPEHNDIPVQSVQQPSSIAPNAQQPPYSEYSSYPPYQLPDQFQQKPFAQLPPQTTPIKKNRRSFGFGQYIVVIALLFVAFAGGWFGNQLYSNSFNSSNLSQSYVNLYQQAWNIVDQHYVDRKAIDYKQMSYKSIQAMLDVLHDKGHTRFLTPGDVQAENQQLSGTFTGIGIYLHQDPKTKQLVITSPIPGSPAEKAGFMHGDIILSVNGVSAAGKDIAGVSSLIQGKAGTSVKITIQRPATHQTMTINVLRQEITVPNVIMHYIAQDHIADIQMVQFASGASNQLKDAITKAQKLGAKKIILDLRENPGGYLQEAIDTASEFVAKGNVFLEQDSSGKRKAYPVSGHTVDTSSPIVVLVNGDTASAAEIVSGSLQDNKRAVILGEKTFGTGTTLLEFPLSDGSAILLGTSEWLTPDGHFIRDLGLSPNIQVKMAQNSVPLSPTDENAGNMTEQQILSSGDTQLVAAIHYLEKH